MVDDPYSGVPDEPGAIPDLVLPVGVADRFDTEAEGVNPPSAWFTLYYTGTAKEGQWRMIGEILVAHDTSELLDRVFDRYPGVQQAAKVTFIPANLGEVYARDWKQQT
jgi:hypothetical protein